jgi:two-component system sensor histidine kinase UhpB
MELRWRLSIAIGLLLTAALAAAAWVAVRNARVAVSGEVDTSLRSATASLTLTLALVEGHDDAEVERVLQAWAAGFTGARHLCVSLESSTAPGDRCVFPDAPRDVPAWFSEGADFTEPPVVRLVPLDGRTLRVHLAADPRDEMREAWVDLRSLLIVIGALAFAVNLCVFLTISFALRPLDRLVRAMEQIGRGERATALPQDGPPEIRLLSNKLGELEDRLARGREQVRSLHLRNLDLQEAERRMVARELHDEICQHVTAIEMEIGRASCRERVS